MSEHERNGLDRLNTARVPASGGLPDALRSRVRRRRWGRRARNAGGATLVLVALVAGAAVMLRPPTAPGEGGDHGAHLGPVLTIDDPMFDGLDGLDGRGTTPQTSMRWRAGSRLSDDLGLEI